MKYDHIRTRKQGGTPFFPNMLNNGNVEVCLKKDVDEAVEELKEKLHDIDDQWNEQCKEIAELKAENAQLKQKLESVQASMYCDVVDTNMENHRLKRALWLARTLRARDIQRWWIAVTCAPKTERACSVWNNVERKCRAKAEEYK